MRKWYRTIKARLTVITVAFTLVATVTIVIASLVQLQAVSRANLLQSIEFNLHMISEQLQGDITLLDRLRMSAEIQPETIRFLQSDSENAGPTRELIERLNEDIQQNPVAYRYLRRIVITDTELSRRLQVGIFADKVALTADTLRLLGEFSETATSDWVGIITDPLAMASNDTVLYRINPVRYRGQDIGYIYFSITTDILMLRLSGYHFHDEGSLYFEVGGLSYRVAEDDFIEESLDLIDAQLSGDTPLNASTEIISFKDASGTRQLAVKSPVGKTGLTLTQIVPEGLVLQETYLVVRLLLVVCFSVVILGLLVAIYLSRIISRPVMQVRKQLATIAGGDFARNSQIEWNNEFGDIGRGINQLAAEIDALIKSRIESEKRKSEAEYKMLQSQINPHFLYNSLNSIKWMATIQKADGIAELTVSLSRLLKSIAKIDQAIVPLSQEIALLEDYFIISRYRYGDSIEYSIDVPEELLDCKIPVFTLQPIVENAIFHGIEAADNGIGTVKVSAEQTDGILEITIIDDGIGMDAKTIQNVLESDESVKEAMFKKVGISNVDSRIKYEYGQEYGISIDSSVGEYTRVTVRLPANNS